MNRPIHTDLARAAQLFLAEGGVCEVRVLGTDRRLYGTLAGYFDANHLDDLVSAVGRADELKGANTYLTINPVQVDLLARAANRLEHHARYATADADVLRRRFLLLDLDPVRPSGIAATDTEHAAALARADDVAAFLSVQGVSTDALVRVDTGNGAAFYIRIDLENDTATLALVRGVLAVLDLRFSDDMVTVDTSVANAARIARLAGTVNRKGDDLPERPHRRSTLLHAPAALVVTPQCVLERIAALGPQEQKRDEGLRINTPLLDLSRWLEEHALAVRRTKPWQGGTVYELETCPFNVEHVNGSAFVGRHANGALFFRCFHNGCSANDWRGLRDLKEPGWRDCARRAKARRGPGNSRTREIKVRSSDTATGETHLTDLGNARRLVGQHGQDLRHCDGRGGWLAWTGQRWVRDQTGEVMRRAKATVLGLYKEAAAITDDDARQKLVAWAHGSESEHRLNAMVQLAASEPGIAVAPEVWDHDLWLLNVLNGTIHLRTGDLQPHRREHLITKLAPVNYNPDATHPLWDKFLH